MIEKIFQCLYDLIKVQHASGKRHNSHLKKNMHCSNVPYYRKKLSNWQKLCAWINHNQYCNVFLLKDKTVYLTKGFFLLNFVRNSFLLGKTSVGVKK